ncbi:MAG: hypothetical protein KC476_07580 [Cyanobacteria bacterium HKST-UBA06]|nr:hypothetical protein [Cyanobacteria bacterium HKST-UBA06]
MISKQLTSALVASAMALSFAFTPLMAQAQYYADPQSYDAASTPSYNSGYTTTTADPYSRATTTDPYATSGYNTAPPASYYDSSATGNYSSTNEYQPDANSYYNQPQQPVLRGHLTTVPVGTIIGVKTQGPINSESAHVGDPINAVVENDVMIDGQTVIPAGSVAYGAITSARPTGRVHQQGKLGIDFNSIRTPSGQTYPLRASVVTPDNTGVIKGNSEQARVIRTVGSAAGITGAGTLAGTAIGGLLGATGSGALFGLGVGALGGIGYAVAKKGRAVEIPSGGRLSIMVTDPNGGTMSPTTATTAYGGANPTIVNGGSTTQGDMPQGQTNFQTGSLTY